ncbi:hypothetical protein AVEN_264880-1 [Araneus ventricosus]|uniref:Uncharacterized protein n=1 Tax=Araneus ventricosus TaxID=182803 RepID=A0A4Y2IN10_ARAVE|nr:hypothetical protein AVEN_264880-1 [Araneus ventricosus]
MTRTTSELAPTFQTSSPYQREAFNSGEFDVNQNRLHGVSSMETGDLTTRPPRPRFESTIQQFRMSSSHRFSTINLRVNVWPDGFKELDVSTHIGIASITPDSSLTETVLKSSIL